ncbi:MAG: thermonuclease family protein [Candidatus Didemnitutus sp.]|nr:thermonuclease family protein [Candidatus Didemnitutus sp.]
MLVCRVWLLLALLWASPLLGREVLNGRVTNVSDGDTLTLKMPNGSSHKVRLFGIDAPELAQSYGDRGRQALNTLVQGKQVRVQVEDTDTYGRKVGRVYVDKQDINVAMVKQGFAWHYEFHAPNDSLLRSAHSEAKSARRGLWSEKKPVAPWDFRRENRKK